MAKFSIPFAATAALLALSTAAPLSSASAQSFHSDRVYQPYYYQLPSRVRITPGTARILGPRRCNRAYPMDESMACGTATGGPVGGRGS